MLEKLCVRRPPYPTDPFTTNPAQAYFYVFAEDQLSPSLIKLHFTFIILTFNVSIVKR